MGRLARQHAAAVLQPDEHPVEVDGLRAERIGEANARLLAPDIRPHDQPEGLIKRAMRGVGEREFQFGLRARIADGIGALRRCGPRGNPVRRLHGRSNGFGKLNDRSSGRSKSNTKRARFGALAAA